MTGEEIGPRLNLAEYCRMYKQEHPDKLVLAHMNGAARAPSDAEGKFFAGHWLYHPGTTLVQDVSADEQDVVLQVADSSIFLTDTGRFDDRADEIGVARVAPDGSIDWLRSELVSINSEDGTIVVERGRFGTQRLAWPAGTYLAPHVIRGPFGAARAGHPLLWAYNYATTCPRDAQGRTCSDALVDDIASLFATGGLLEGLDGLEFDVFPFAAVEAPAVRPGLVDVDADGVADSGVVDGVNVYGLGTFRFLQHSEPHFRTRSSWPMAHRLVVRVSEEGVNYSNQRGFSVLNGVETEGFLDPTDHEITRCRSGRKEPTSFDSGNRTPWNPC